MSLSLANGATNDWTKRKGVYTNLETRREPTRAAVVNETYENCYHTGHLIGVEVGKEAHRDR